MAKTNITQLLAELDKSKAIALMEVLARKFEITSEEFDLEDYQDWLDTRDWKLNNYWEQENGGS